MYVTKMSTNVSNAMVLSGSQLTQLLCYNRCYILLIIKLHVSASSGHHQVLSIQNPTRWCYTICV